MLMTGLSVVLSQVSLPPSPSAVHSHVPSNNAQTQSNHPRNYNDNSVSLSQSLSSPVFNDPQRFTFINRVDNSTHAKKPIWPPAGSASPRRDNPAYGGKVRNQLTKSIVLQKDLDFWREKATESEQQVHSLRQVIAAMRSELEAIQQETKDRTIQPQIKGSESEEIDRLSKHLAFVLKHNQLLHEQV